MSDEQVPFLSDIFPTGYMGAEMCNIEPGHVVAVWGAGPVERSEIDPSFVITHRLPLTEAARGYEMFIDTRDDCEKVVLKAA